MFFRLLLTPLLLAPVAGAMEMDDISQPLEIHFGGDVNYGKKFGDAATPNVFSLGIIDTMFHGRFSRSFSVLSEIVVDLHLRLGELEAIAEGAIIHHDLGRVTATNYGGYVQGSYGLREDLHFYGRAERFMRDSAEGYLNTPTTSNFLGGIRFDPVPGAAIKSRAAGRRSPGWKE